MLSQLADDVAQMSMMAAHAFEAQHVFLDIVPQSRAPGPKIMSELLEGTQTAISDAQVCPNPVALALGADSHFAPPPRPDVCQQPSGIAQRQAANGRQRGAPGAWLGVDCRFYRDAIFGGGGLRALPTHLNCTGPCPGRQTPKPAPYIKDMLAAAQYHGNRVLMDHKGTPTADWMRAYFGVLEALGAFVKQHHPTGLVWGTKVRRNGHL